MNTHSFIPHRMFVAALAGERRPPTTPAPWPASVATEAGAASAAPGEKKRRREAASEISLRQVLSFGQADGI